MSNFTQGKWKYLDNLYQVVSYPENEPVFYYGNAPALWHDITGELNIGLNNSEEEAHANGRLIAAAPEMYEMLFTLFNAEYISPLDIEILRRKWEKLIPRIKGEVDEHD